MFKFLAFSLGILFLNLNFLWADKATAGIELQCQKFEAESTRGNVTHSATFKIDVYSNELTIALGLLGEGAQSSFSSCRPVQSEDPDDKLVIKLFGAPTNLIALRMILGEGAPPSNTSVDAVSFSNAEKTSTWSTRISIVNDLGEEEESLLAFRRRTFKVWEFYYLLSANRFENTAAAASNNSVIVELGTITFDDTGQLEAVKFWHSEDGTSDDRFFKSYIPENEEEIDPGKLMYASSDKARLRWKGGRTSEDFQLDFGQLGSENAQVVMKKNGKNGSESKLLKFAIDGRLGSPMLKPEPPSPQDNSPADDNPMDEDPDDGNDNGEPPANSQPPDLLPSDPSEG